MARLVVSIGKVLQKRMNEQCITTSDLADSMNMSENEIERILIGDLFLPPRIYENLCTILNTSFDEVVGAAVKTP